MFANNVITIQGRAGNDPEISHAGEYRITEVTVAVYRYDKKKTTDWVKCKFFGKPGELCEQFVKKGSQVMIVGSLRIDKYEKDGQKRESVYIAAENVTVISGGVDKEKEFF